MGVEGAGDAEASPTEAAVVDFAVALLEDATAESENDAATAAEPDLQVESENDAATAAKPDMLVVENIP